MEKSNKYSKLFTNLSTKSTKKKLHINHLHILENWILEIYLHIFSSAPMFTFIKIKKKNLIIKLKNSDSLNSEELKTIQLLDIEINRIKINKFSLKK